MFQNIATALFGYSKTDARRTEQKNLEAAIVRGRVSASQLEGYVFDPRPLSELPQWSLGKNVHLNRPCKDQASACHQLPSPKIKNACQRWNAT